MQTEYADALYVTKMASIIESEGETTQNHPKPPNILVLLFYTQSFRIQHDAVSQFYQLNERNFTVNQIKTNSREWP